MTPLTDVQQVLAYHEETKHHPHRYARSMGYLDWANQPHLGTDSVEAAQHLTERGFTNIKCLRGGIDADGVTQAAVESIEDDEEIRFDPVHLVL